MRTIELLVSGGTVVTLDPDQAIVRNGAVAADRDHSRSLQSKLNA